MTIKYITICLLFFFLYLVSYAIFVGIKNPIPELGDSFDYHIPISQSIIDGSFLDPHPPISLPQRYYPGTTEAINSLLMALGIPLTLSNILAILVLVFTLWRLGLAYRLSRYYSLLFALSFCSLTVITRWFNAVSIDVWVTVFFALSIIFLKDPKKSLKHSFLLGITLGALAGSKYPALLSIALLLIVFRKQFISIINFRAIIVFIVPFSVLGLSWYIRNYIHLGNPVFPLCIPFFPCQKLFTDNVLSISHQYPALMFNAFFSEYRLWILSPLVIGMLWIKTKLQVDPEVKKLLLLGFGGLILFLFYPTGYQPWIMVSSLRYSYPVFIPFFLSIFLLAKQYKKEEILGIFAFINALPVLTMAFYPKLLLITVPLGLGVIYLLDRKSRGYSTLSKVKNFKS